MRYLVAWFLALGSVAAAGETDTLDVLEFRRGPVWPEIYYANSSDQSSKTVTDKVMVLDGIEVVINIRLGSTILPGAERIMVESEDPNIMFEVAGTFQPAQSVEFHVKDGEHVIIYVKPPLF